MSVLRWWTAAASQIRIRFFWKRADGRRRRAHQAGDEIVGAIGVSRSPGSVYDEEMCDAGIAKIAARLS
jgi:hypothetical protein